MGENRRGDDMVGRRVRLISTTDPYTELVPGDIGTARLVDSLGTLHIQWDTGAYLGLVPDEDRWEVVLDETGEAVSAAGLGT